MKNKVLIQYVTSAKHGRTGVVVAVCENKLIKIGWSAVNIKAGDKFDRIRALKIAFQRTEAKTIGNAPHRILKLADKMLVRAQRYFIGPVNAAQ